MAKGLNRGNREAKKPKQPPKKEPVKALDLFTKASPATEGKKK